MTLDEIKALLDAFKQAAKYNPSGNVEVGRAAESAARAALLQAVEELHQNYLDAAESSNQHRKRAEAAEAKQDRLLAERDAANETARRVAAEREAVRVSATKCVEDVRVIGQRYRDNWSDFDGRTLKEELIEATWGLERALSSSPRAESEGPDENVQVSCRKCGSEWTTSRGALPAFRCLNCGASVAANLTVIVPSSSPSEDKETDRG